MSEDEQPHLKKWGAYRSEERAFRFALGGAPDASTPSLRALSKTARRSIEAELMDWADDVAYSVHDVEDFFRAGLVPLDRVMTDYGDEQKWFLARADTEDNPLAYKQAFLDLVKGLKKLGGLISAPYRDRQEERVRLNEC